MKQPLETKQNCEDRTEVQIVVEDKGNKERSA